MFGVRADAALAVEDYYTFPSISYAASTITAAIVNKLIRYGFNLSGFVLFIYFPSMWRSGVVHDMECVSSVEF